MSEKKIFHKKILMAFIGAIKGIVPLTIYAYKFIFSDSSSRIMPEKLKEILSEDQDKENYFKIVESLKDGNEEELRLKNGETLTLVT